ncbi:Hypothetical protein NTJ_02406 [Nesidiocoris tenuis]|uniref:BTB domain-containing protein n=1 Tax=Nesidiocoris tenuis TaxID=355587 RepID=A0ABN7AE15_9HEMI|nr:Hypothetical protein NTJ_02406 [Nesidiocoris tenuis]
MQSAQRAGDIIASLKQQISTGDLCDVLFYNKTGSVWAHSCVLAAFSPILSQMISLRLNNGDHWSIRQPMQISIHQLTMSEPESESDCLLCLSQVISYIYTGTIDIDNCHKEHVHALSEHFQNCELLAVFERYKKLSKCIEVGDTHPEDKNVNGIDLNSSGKDCEPLSRENEESKEGMATVEIKSTKTSSSETVTITDEQTSSGDTNSKNESQTVVCDKCNYLSHDPQLVDVHSKIFHNSNYYKCLNCKFHNRNLNKLVEHIVESCHSFLICSICLVKSVSPSEMLCHVQIHRGSEPFQCAVCQRRFGKRNLWLKHVLSHYPKHTFSCKKCSLSFMTDRQREKHCGPESQHRSVKHVCLECGFIAPYNHVLEKHKLKHRKPKYECDQNDCGFYTSSEAMLVRHKAVHKFKTKPIKDTECPDCKMKFTLQKNLTRHMKIHLGESKKVKCSLCSYETLRKDKLREHCMVKHDSELDDAKIKLKRSAEAVDISEPVQQEIILGQNGTPVRGDSEKSPEDEPKVAGMDNFKTPSNRNTLLMDSKGDISIVNSDKNNSVTLRNIGNLTGSITLDEKTGILTMNNINSGSVFLNETTGELTYINLEPQKETESSSKAAVPQNEGNSNDVTFEFTKLDEFTGEIVRVASPPVDENNSTEQENDPCDMDLVNDDSLDGFDDFDELLFDVINEGESTMDYNKTANGMVQNDVPLAVPRLDESTGLLTFDNGYQQPDMSWDNGYGNGHSSRMDDEQAYQLLLDEATGVLHI